MEDVGGLFDGQATEEPHDDQVGQTRVDRPQPDQCSFEIEEVHFTCSRDADIV
jgi:hypothetical protein